MGGDILLPITILNVKSQIQNKSQITNSKLQINPNDQIRSSKLFFQDVWLLVLEV
jgi:hypothetical protein